MSRVRSVPSEGTFLVKNSACADGVAVSADCRGWCPRPGRSCCGRRWAGACRRGLPGGGRRGRFTTRARSWRTWRRRSRWAGLPGRYRGTAGTACPGGAGGVGPGGVPAGQLAGGGRAPGAEGDPGRAGVRAGAGLGAGLGRRAVIRGRPGRDRPGRHDRDRALREGAGLAHLEEDLQRRPPTGDRLGRPRRGREREPLAIALQPGNAGSNTAADHIEATKLALAQLPRHLRRKALVRADSGGGTTPSA